MKFSARIKRYDDVTTLESEDLICYCIGVDKGTLTEAIRAGAKLLEALKERTGACTGSDCKRLNPNGRCCSREIRQLIDLEGR